MHQAYFQKQSVFLLQPFPKRYVCQGKFSQQELQVQKALNQVSFEIQPKRGGRFFGFNGAGKSTMMKIITSFETF